MIPFKYVPIIILLFLIKSQSLSIFSSMKNSSFGYSATVNALISRCMDHKTVVLLNPQDFKLTQVLYDTSSISNYSHNTSILHLNRINLSKIDFLILFYEIDQRLENVLLSLHDTFWWNIMETFLIIDRSMEKCRNAENILQQFWKHNIVIAIFVCFNNNDQLMMFAFNPFTNRAPKPWKPVETSRKQRDRWTLYYRLYDNEDNNPCDNLYFDRTTHLDGFEIKATFPLFNSHLNEDFLRYYNTSKLSISDTLNYLTITAMEELMTATVEKFYYAYDVVNLTKNFHGVEEEIYDVAYAVVPMQTKSNLSVLYPISAFDTVILTQKRGYYTSIEKIFKFYGPTTVISLTIILSILLFVISKSQKNKNLSFAFFEIIRLLINTGLHSKIKTTSLRIFFFVIFTYFLILHSTFSGHLPTFLTKREARKTPETTKDLEDSYIKAIYIPKSFSFDYANPKLVEKMVLMNNYDCQTPVLNDSGNVCLFNKQDLIWLTGIYNNLHVSDKPIAADYYSFFTRNDWPLKNRMDNAIIWSFNLGYASDYWIKKYTEKIDNLNKRTSAKSFIKFQPIILKNIIFLFTLLVSGLSCAGIIFCLEIIIHRRKIK